MQRMKFKKGEKRHIKLLIHSTDNENTPFVIREAEYELLCGGIVESKSICEIFEHIVDAYIEPQKCAVYRLNIKYFIADETFIESIEVMVE